MRDSLIGIGLQIYTDFIPAMLKLLEKYNKTMNTNKKYFFPFITLAIATSLSSCNSTPITPTINPNITSSPTPSITQPVKVQPSQTPSKTTNVTLYTSDTQCQELVPKKASVPAQEPVTGAIGKILEETDTGDFSFSGYRVNIKNGIATIDLRLSPQSKRQLASLSSCEQLVLFGSLRKTLTSNAQWKIKEVRFTQLGKEIVL